MARRSGLGRGLGALIPTGEPAGVGEAVEGGDGGLRELPVASIHPNRYQPRAAFDPESLASLAASIRTLGLLQPVLVRADGEGYELIAGERRWRAAREAGLATIPALVREVDDNGALEQALVENLHRDDLNAIEEAAAYVQLAEDFGLTYDDIAGRVGRSKSGVANLIRLLNLPPAVQQLVMERRLTAGHARALLALPDAEAQLALAEAAIAGDLSVRAVEDAVRRALAPPPPGPSERGAPERPAGVLEVEQVLAEHLATRVRVELRGRSRGRVVVEFADLDDLDRLYRLLVAPATD